MSNQSWYDRLLGRLLFGHRLPWWAIIAIVFVVLAMASSAVIWIEGTQPVGRFGRPAIDSFYAPYGLFMYVFLSRSARRGLEKFRPALAPGDFERFLPRLTGLTNGQTLLAILIFGSIAISYLASLVGGDDRAEIIGESLAGLILVGGVGAVLGYGIIGLAFILLIRVLIGISAIHRVAIDVDLLRPGPIHAFAPVTARGGVLVLFIVTFSALSDPRTFTDPVQLGLVAGLGIVATLAFVLPLAGMRRRLIEQKADMLDAVSERLKKVDDEIEAIVDAGRYDDTAPLIATRGVLESQRDRIKKASTLPWETATLRGFATALLIPVVSWLVTNLLSRTLFG